MGKFYITTTLPYVNDKPHIGHALEFVQADSLARFWRLTENDVFFNIGTDEHGQKIYEAAQKAGQDVQEYVDHFAGEFNKLPEALGLSNDAFIRTTDPKHKEAAQEIWRRCKANGDIEKREYEGLYCVGCERFIKESELVDGKCPDHNKEPELLKEENYFFAFSKYEGQLLEYLSREDSIVPEWRRQEAITFVKNGLEDFSISRERKRLSWGVPVPDDDDQVMYVWFDALTSYISTLGWPKEDGDFKTYWEEGTTYQFAGKDQIRFQSLMWQAMLMSAGIKNTDHIFYHGFINSGGQKMSKSIGNVISPFELIEKYGAEATRYLLLRHVHPTEDTDITWEKLDEWYTAHLVNGIGNLVARVMKLCEEHLETPIQEPERTQGEEEVARGLEQLSFNTSLDLIFSLVTSIDERITREEPFKLVKSDPERGREELAGLAAEVWNVGKLLEPFMPVTGEAIVVAVLKNKKPENLFPRLQ